MKNNIKLLGLSALSMAPNLQDAVAQKKDQRPNILLILADDMGYSDLGCYGSEISTPNLDHLASEGLRMTQFYNSSRCCPTRASLLTGLYQHQTGVGHMVNNLNYPGYIGHLNNQCVTMAEALKANGYNTYMSGKWHIGGVPAFWPRKRGFDRYFGLIDGASNYFKLIPYRNNQSAPRMALDDSLYTPPSDGFYMTNAITDYAIRFLNEEKPKKEPFFLYLAFTAPHWPLNALPEDIAKYRGKYMKGWDKLRVERYKKLAQLRIIDTTNIKLSPRDKNSTDWENLSQKDKEMWDLRMAVYAAMVDRMDQNIGRVLKKLEEMGEKENTLIIFLSDNGGSHEPIKNFQNYVRMPGETGTPESLDSYEYNWANLSNTPFRLFKHWVHEGGISTPFIAWYPKLIKPSINNEVGHITDLMPTFMDISHGKYPKTYNGNSILPMEGKSLTPIFKGKNLKRKTPVFFEHQGNRAVRDGKWKLVSKYDEETKRFLKWELYDMEKDRSELQDVSEMYPNITIRLIVKYEEWAKRAGVISKEIIDSKKRMKNEE
jgi:arylsulfatase A-like enzyme